MKTNWSLAVLVVAVLLAGSFAVYAEPGAVSGKKLIEYGWDVPTLEYIVSNLPAMEERLHISGAATS